MQDLNFSKTEWDLSPLLNGDNDPSIEQKKKEISDEVGKFIQKWKNKDDYLNNPETLREALDDYEELLRNYGTSGGVGYYFYLRGYQEETNPDIMAKLNIIEEFSKKLANEIQFFTINISKIPESEQKKFLNDKKLDKYKHFLENSFKNAKYILSEKEERIINLKETPSYSLWEKMILGLLSKQERDVLINEMKIKKNFSEIQNLLEHTDKRVRDSAADAFNDILDKYSEVAESEINAVLLNKKIDDELRGMERPDTSRHIADDIDQETVDFLIDAVFKRFDIVHRFYKLKTKLLGVDKLSYYERNVPYAQKEVNYSYDEAVNLVYRVLSRIDSSFSDMFRMYLENGQIDVYPKKGKHSGGFCMNNLILQPTYILLNYTGTIKDVTTLAHELGHGFNNEFMKMKQHALNFGTPKSTAEVASTFMEDFIFEELLKDADEETRLSLIISKLNGDISSVFRQVAFYRFESELHSKFREKGYLSKEEIGGMFRKHMEQYMGNAIDISGAGNWWIYVPHFRYFFYVYSYASGTLISKSLQREVKKDHSFVEKVKEFLSTGTSDSPKNIFMNLGIDISNREFWDKGLGEFDELLKEAEELARKLGKI